MFGWKEFFKFTLWVLARIKEELMELGFDRILNMLGEILKSELFTKEEGITAGEFAEQLGKFRVTNSLLGKLEKDYRMTVEK